MVYFSQLKAIIEEAIRENGREEITGDILQGILLSIVEELGDEEINNLYQAIAEERLAAYQAGNSTKLLNQNAEEVDLSK